MYYSYKKWSTAKKCNYNGSQFDSKFEARHAQDLDLMVKAGEIKSYEKQKTIDLVVNGYVVCTYRIDFIVYHNDGITEYQELKGRASREWVNKWKLFEALYSDLPDVKLTVIYQGNNHPKMRKLKKKI